MGEGDPSAADAHRGDLAAGEQRGHFVRMLGPDCAHEVDPVVDPAQSPGLQAGLNLLARDPGRQELHPCDDSELRARKRSDHTICEVSVGFSVYTTENPALDGIAPGGVPGAG